MRAYCKDRFPGRLFIVEGIDGSGKTDVTRRGKKKHTDVADRTEQHIIPPLAVKPTIAFYFRISVDEAMKRIVGGRDAISDSFTAYQGRFLNVFDTMAREYEFHVVDSSASIQNVSEQIKGLVEPLLIVA